MIYLGRKKSTDVFFILLIIGIKFQMGDGDFEGLLYNMLSEEPFKNQRTNITDEKDGYTIFDYISHHFGILIGQTWKCLTCHAKKHYAMKI